MILITLLSDKFVLDIHVEEFAFSQLPGNEEVLLTVMGDHLNHQKQRCRKWSWGDERQVWARSRCSRRVSSHERCRVKLVRLTEQRVRIWRTTLCVLWDPVETVVAKGDIVSGFVAIQMAARSDLKDNALCALRLEGMYAYNRDMVL